MSNRHAETPTIDIQSFVCCFPIKTARNVDTVTAKTKETKSHLNQCRIANVVQRHSRPATAFMARQTDR